MSYSYVTEPGGLLRLTGALAAFLKLLDPVFIGFALFFMFKLRVFEYLYLSRHRSDPH
jgi:hypothetical protein